MYGIIAGTLQTRLTSVLASTLLIGYCGGLFYTEMEAGVMGPDPFGPVGAPADWIAYAVLLVMLGCISLLIGGLFEPPLVLERLTVRLSWKQERFLWFAAGFFAFAFWQGNLGYMGTANTNGKVSILGELGVTVAALLPGIGTIGIVQSSGFRRMRFVVLTLLFLAGEVTFSRRGVAYALVICVFAAVRLSGRTWRITPGRKALLIAGGILAVVAASFVFMGLRMATWHLGRGKHSIASIFEESERSSLVTPETISTQLGENMEARPAFLIRYLALLGHGGNTASPLYGQDAALAVEMATPDAVYHFLGLDKGPIRDIGVEENLANEHFGLLDTDMANSVLTGGIIDFGLAGVLVYPLLVCFFLRYFLSVVSSMFSTEGQILATLAIFCALLQSEVGLSVYSVAGRNALILVVLWEILSKIPKLTSQRTEKELRDPSLPHALRQETAGALFE